MQELPPFVKFAAEVLIFRSSSSQMFFKIGILKNFARFTGKILQLLLLDFRGSKSFFQLNLVFIADSCTGFYSELL